MRKQNSIIFGSLILIALISGCGMPGPLYQEPAEKNTETATTKAPEKKQEQ